MKNTKTVAFLVGIIIIVAMAACGHRSDPAYEYEKQAIRDSISRDSLQRAEADSMAATDRTQKEWENRYQEGVFLQGTIFFDKECQGETCSTAEYDFRQNSDFFVTLRIRNYMPPDGAYETPGLMPLEYATRIEGVILNKLPDASMVSPVKNNDVYYDLFLAYSSEKGKKVNALKKAQEIVAAIAAANPGWKITTDKWKTPASY